MLKATAMADTLGQRLRLLRKAKGLRLEDVAPHVSTDPGSVSRLEHDKREPSLAQLRAFADLYGVSIVALLKGLNGRRSKVA